MKEQIAPLIILSLVYTAPSFFNAAWAAEPITPAKPAEPAVTNYPPAKPAEPAVPTVTPAKPVESKIISPGVELREEGVGGCRKRLTVSADVLFEFDKSDLTPQAEVALSKVGPTVASFGKHPVLVEGHTDSKGSDEYNQRLSERRADTVKNWLVMKQSIAGFIQGKGYGEKNPVAPNTQPNGQDFPEGRQKNRRVEIVVNACPTS